jgi:hypothetical protein
MGVEPYTPCARSQSKRSKSPLQADQQRIFDAIQAYIADDDGQSLLSIDGGAGVDMSR